MIQYQIIAYCWLGFVFYWIVSAFAVKRAAEQQPIRARLAHRLPVWIGIFLLFSANFDPRPRVIIPHTPGIAWVAAALTVAGLAFAVWARRTIADNWSSDVEFKQAHKLVQRGPYGLARHPIYTGLLLMVLGSAIAGGRIASLLAVPCFFTGFWIKLKMEERLMLRHFPREYPDYQRRVKALVPGVL